MDNWPWRLVQTGGTLDLASAPLVYLRDLPVNPQVGRKNPWQRTERHSKGGRRLSRENHQRGPSGRWKRGRFDGMLASLFFVCNC